jgi:hypothetical protein
MTDLETELRHALHRRADDVPADASARLAATDYRPSGHSWRPRVAAGGVVGAAAATGVLVSALGGASTAFAGWSPQPTAPTRAQLSAALANCQVKLPFSPPPLVVSDTRGPFTFQIFADARTIETCINGPSFSNVSGVRTSAPITVGADQLNAMAMHTTAHDGDAYSFADGKVGGHVTGVKIRLGDGSVVTATVDNGWFVAWWPGASQARAFLVSTPSGTHTEPFTTKAAPPCPKGATCDATLAGGRGGYSVGAAETVMGSGTITGRSTGTIASSSH